MQEPKYLTPCALAGAAIFLYLQLFMFPGTPVLPSGDQTIFLLDGRRMLEGQVLYRDFFQFLFPGTEFVYFALFKLFGAWAWVADATLVLLGVGFVWTSLIISRQLFAGVSVLLPGFLFLAIPFRNAPMSIGAHHWYSALAVMIALAVLIEKRTPRRLAVAGALCGLSSWFNQTRGLMGLIGFAIFLLWERYENKETWRSLLRRAVPLFASFFLALVALSGYFVWKAGLSLFLDSTVVFVWKYFPQSPPNRWSQYGADMPPLAQWRSTTPLGTWLMIELLVPWIYLLFFWSAWRGRNTRREEPWDRLILVAIVGLCLFLGVAPSAMNYRLCTVSFPALILLVWFAHSGIARRAPLVLGVALLALMIAETHSIQTRWHETLQLPIGWVASFNRQGTEELQWLLSRQRPPDFLMAPPEVNFSLGLRNPAPVDSLTPFEYTRPEQVQSTIRALRVTAARWVVWEQDLEMPTGPSDHLRPLGDYLRAHYHVAAIFDEGDRQILERNRQ